MRSVRKEKRTEQVRGGEIPSQVAEKPLSLSPASRRSDRDVPAPSYVRSVKRGKDLSLPELGEREANKRNPSLGERAI